MVQTRETAIEKWAREYEGDPHYRAEGLATDTIEQVISKLREVGESQAGLARRLDVKPQLVSRMMNAPPNLTLLSIARLAIALGTKPKILFDSEAFFIRSHTDTYNWEDFETDRATLRGARPSTDAASVRSLIGVSPNATAG